MAHAFVTDVDALRTVVLGRTALRDLPWRQTRDPWAVLVAEAMLQQTQVTRVVPRWHSFLQRFPDVETCASARVGEVVDEWAGLGYNRRAVQLHACAVAICERHAGTIPDDLDSLRALPGIGAYTARAVLAFAFERDVAVVDTNVARVLARVGGRRLGATDAQARADALVPSERGWEWNQAMLDFGALSCTKRAPQCASCDARPVCAWKGEGPDPAIGSAGVGRGQSRFEGSDRQGRGRLVDAMRVAPVAIAELAAVMGWGDDHERARRVADTLLPDGLAVLANGAFELP